MKMIFIYLQLLILLAGYGLGGREGLGHAACIDAVITTIALIVSALDSV